jgi:5'(3')-deoxyribonucleotidase
MQNQQPTSELPYLLSDADGVCLDLISGFNAYMFSETQEVALTKPQTQFDFSDIYPMFSAEQIKKHIRDFVNDPYHFSHIKAYPKAVSAYKKIHETGRKIIIITACGDAHGTKAAREECFDREYGPIISDIIFAPYTGSKNDILSKFNKTTFLDDHLPTCLEASKTQHKIVVLNRSYNSNQDTFDHLPNPISRLDCISNIGQFLS